MPPSNTPTHLREMPPQPHTGGRQNEHPTIFQSMSWHLATALIFLQPCFYFTNQHVFSAPKKEPSRHKRTIPQPLLHGILLFLLWSCRVFQAVCQLGKHCTSPISCQQLDIATWPADEGRSERRNKTRFLGNQGFSLGPFALLSDFCYLMKQYIHC